MNAAATKIIGPITGLVAREGKASRFSVRGMPELVEAMVGLYRREGIGEKDAFTLATANGSALDPARTQRVLAQLFAGELPVDVKGTVALAHDLEQRFDLTLPTDGLAGPIARAGWMFARCIGVVLGVSCLYLVVGGLLLGESERFGGLSGPAALVVFGASLAFLGLFEAMHTSVTQLRLADLRGLADTYPRTLVAHRRFRDDTGISRVLAGRQIVVVITVFVVAGLSSFPHMEMLPFTDVEIPTLFLPAIEIGFPGALVVLWVAQLMPQYYATRNAVAMMNTRIATWALDLAFALDAMGIADPSRWVFSSAHAHERIPISPALQWEQNAAEVEGDGLLSVKYNWQCRRDGATLEAVSTTAVRRDGHPLVDDSSLTLPSGSSALSISSDIAGANGATRICAPTDYAEDPLPGGQVRLHKPVAPAVGSFTSGDRIQVAVDAVYSRPLQRDSVLVERPTRFMIWRLSLEDSALRVSDVTIRTYRVEGGPGDLTPTGEELRLRPEPDSSQTSFSYAVAFPPSNTLFVFEWEVTWR